MKRFKSYSLNRQTHRRTDRQTDRQTDTTENITYPHSRVVIKILDICFYSWRVPKIMFQQLGNCFALYHVDLRYIHDIIDNIAHTICRIRNAQLKIYRTQLK